MSLVNPTQQILPLQHGIDNLLIESFVEYLLSKPTLTNIFRNNIFPFHRFDVSSPQFPAMNVYVLEQKEKSSSYWHYGTLFLDILLPINIVKANKTLSARNLVNHIHLLTMQDVIEFLETKVVGIFFFGFNNKTDFRGLYDSNPDRNKITMQFEYKVSLQAYYKWLINNGYDLSSPDIVINPELDTLSIDVDLQE